MEQMGQLVNMRLEMLTVVIEIVDFPMKNGGSFHSYVKLPEGRILTMVKH